jgi:hypothetical protein
VPFASVTEWKRAGVVDLASLCLSIEEGKTIVAEIQTQMVAVQVEHHGQARRCCVQCRRVKACRNWGEEPALSMFTWQSSTAPELRYLNAKLAALLPFRKVAGFLNEVLPDTAAA